MQPALAPFLLSLLASISPIPARGDDLVVRVVDKDGKPVAGVQVGLCPQGSGHSSTSRIGFSDTAGNARIVGALDTVRKDTQHEFSVRLGMPADPDVRVDLDRAHLDDARPVLIVPDHGRAAFKLPTTDKCTLRLRVVPGSAEPTGSVWSGSALPQISCEQGKGAADFVGLGLDVEYEVLGDTLPRPLHGFFKSPTRSGEVLEVAVPGYERSATLVARLVGEDLRPISGVKLMWSVEMSVLTQSEARSTSNGGEVLTDKRGKVVIPLSEIQARWVNRSFSIKATLAPTEFSPIRNSFANIRIPDSFQAGVFDLGELRLVHFGSPLRFEGLDDHALEQRFLTLVDSHARSSWQEGDAHVEILCEMIRRGGIELERFVAKQAEAVPKKAPMAPWGRADELALRTALARMRHESDPLTIVVEPRSKLEVEFPDTPVLECSLKNCQTGEWSLLVPERGGPYDCGFEVFDSKGTRIEAQSPTDLPGGMYGLSVLEPGKSMPLSVRFGTAISLPRAGEYRVRVHYSWWEDLAWLDSVQGRIVASTPEFTVRVRPCTILLSRARRDELRAAVRSLDLGKTLPLVSWHWRPTLTFTGAAVLPEEVLFRAGREALPALFEALEDSKLEPERRAWVFAMLWNILGGNDPSQAAWFGVIGPSSGADAWPTSSEASTRFGRTERLGFGKIDPEKQAEFTKLWLETKSNYELKIVP